MATYSLDTEHHTIVTIDGQDYAVGIIQDQDELIERIQSIDEQHDGDTIILSNSDDT